jgi:hypothetical protein
VIRKSNSGAYLMTRILPGHEATPSAQPGDSERFSDLLGRMAAATEHARLGVYPCRLEAVVLNRRIGWMFETGIIFEPGYVWELTHMPDAKALLSALAATTGRPRLLHGDLQPKNILVAEAGRWQAIDPILCCGDVNAEAALWAVCQQGGSLIEERIAELGAISPLLHEGRLRAWAFVLGVAEYRLYRPEIARRISEFTRANDYRRLMADI